MYCNKCGAKNPDGEDIRFCYRCGSIIDPFLQEKEEKPSAADELPPITPTTDLREPEPEPEQPLDRLFQVQPVTDVILERLPPVKNPALSLRNFIVLYIATFSLYGLYWYYRNWRALKEDPDWAQMLFDMYRFYADVKRFAVEIGAKVRYAPAVTLIVVLVFSAMTTLGYPFWLLGLGSIWPLTAVQDALNQYWRLRRGLTPDSGFSKRQVLLVVMGAMLWFLVLIAH